MYLLYPSSVLVQISEIVITHVVIRFQYYSFLIEKLSFLQLLHLL
jgi:hypothetical protein